SKGRARLARLVPDDPRQHKRRKRYTKAIEAMLAGTDTDYGRWHLIPANDEDFARHAVATTLIRRIDEEITRRAARQGAHAASVPAAGVLGTSVSLLRSADQTKKLEDEDYSDRLRKAQLRLSELLYDCVDQHRSAV